MDKSYIVKDEQSGDWVVITPEKSSPERSRDTDGQSAEPSDQVASAKELNFEESDDKTPEELQAEVEEVNVVEEVKDIESPPESDTENEKPVPDSTNNSSDIDIIDEDENSSDDELSTASLCSSSVVSQMSNLSFLRDQYLLQSHLLNPEDRNTEDLSETSSLNYRELNPDVDLNRGPRAYVHTPNTGLNGKLNLILVLSVFTVIGLGIGNYIGWSNHWSHNSQLSMGQVIKLKQLQDELVVCMQNQNNRGPHMDGHKPQVCYLDNEYWREKFQTLFSENKGLLDLFEKTQKHFHSNGNLDNVISDKDCDNKSASDEFHNLKLGLLVNQMEHLKLLKTLEEIQYKGRQSEKRVQVLEVENKELKMKLVEEEADDEIIVQSWGDKVKVLEDQNKELHKRLEDDEEEDSLLLKKLNQRIDDLLAENNELKTAIYQLEAQVVMVDKSPNISPLVANSDGQDSEKAKVPIKLDLLKQRINQMVIENDELKSTIARLRWADHQSEEQIKDNQKSGLKSDPLESEELDESEEESVENFSEDVIIIKEENDLLATEMEEQLNLMKEMLSSEQNEAKMWKEMYEKLKEEMFERVVKDQTEDTAQKKEDKSQKTEFFDENVVYDWVLNSTNVLRDALFKGSGVVGDKLKQMLDKITENGDIFRGINATQSVLFDLNSQLRDKWQELQDLKTVFSNGNQKISNKMSKLLDKTIRKLQEASSKLLTKDEDINQRVTDFSNHMNRLINNLDKKWNNLLNKLSDRYAKQTESSAEETVDEFESSEPKINWFFERAKSRKYQQNSASETKTSDGNHETSYESIVIDEESDEETAGGDDDDVSEEENWFLRKARKPKSDDQYDDQFERYRRPNKLRANRQYAHRFEYNQRQSRHR